jgi:hypothetical protein
MSEKHNVFISHRHEDDALVADFKKLLDGRGVDIRDASITSDIPNDANSEEYIKSEILAPGIHWAGKIVVIITPDTCNHPWVDWEVQYAESYGDKEIIGVWAPGDTGCELPDSIAKHADSVVSWSADAIIDALNGNSHWEQPDGTPRGNQPISRIGCS